MDEKTSPMSCIDCAQKGCGWSTGNYPSFCLSQGMDPDVKASAMAEYDIEENRKMMQAAAVIEHDFYCRFTRVEETIELARVMGYRKLGIATCVGLLRESRTLAKILRHHGFEVYGIGCKAGEVCKQDVGIPERCNEVGPNMCNPVLQAKVLEAAGTQLNIVVGLCVGHDSLFYKYSAAPVTTLVVKDRVTGHNPVAVLNTADGYYAKKLFGEAKF